MEFSGYQILIKMPKMSIWELIYDIYSADKDETKSKQKNFLFLLMPFLSNAPPHCNFLEVVLEVKAKLF